MATAHTDQADLVEASAGNVTRANDTLGAFDNLIMPAVINRTQTSAPGSPSEGDRYIAGTGVSGWTGTRNGVASQSFVAEDYIIRQGGGWKGWSPEEGWMARVNNEDIAIVFDGTDWVFAWSEKVTTGITTNGTTIASTTVLNFGFSQLTVIAAGNTACRLPAAEKNAQVIVTNDDASGTDSALIFPFDSGDEINVLGAGNSFTLAHGKTVIFFCVNGTNWYGVLSA